MKLTRTLRLRILLVSAAVLLLCLASSCSLFSKTGFAPTETGAQEEISFQTGKENGGEGRKEQNGSALRGEVHPLFYLNGAWSAVGAYDDDLYYDYDEIDEMSLVFENGWVAMTAGGSTSVYPVETEGDMLFFTVSGGSELGDARVVIDYYDNGYLLGLIPENDPAFELLFERQ